MAPSTSEHALGESGEHTEDQASARRGNVGDLEALVFGRGPDVVDERAGEDRGFGVEKVVGGLADDRGGREAARGVVAMRARVLPVRLGSARW